MAPRDSRTRITATNTASAVFDAVGKSSAKMAGAISRASDVGANLTIITAGLAAASKKLAAAMAVPIKAAAEQERVEAQLAAVLHSTKEAAGLSVDQLKKMAAGFQDVTHFGDEAVIGMQGVLLTFKEISGEGGIFERTTAVSLDLATAMGMDLKSAALQVGKALNDPATGLSMLTRVGITFTEQQKSVIKELQATGDIAGAQGVTAVLQVQAVGSGDIDGVHLRIGIKFTVSAVAVARLVLPGKVTCTRFIAGRYRHQLGVFYAGNIPGK